ncbi:MAG: hypothetical protein IPK94_06695 [Saprospiraceae bacterium]|nr:hypothetical protein [Saprospiraceae bacterium]MBK8279805.1 hypothetical protein [Saprospiraceae bacterium]MBK9928839.1 hypothetical protein [Saprospiraceae bacterium]
MVIGIFILTPNITATTKMYYSKYCNISIQRLSKILKRKYFLDRSHLGIAGFSMEGDGALRIGLKHSDKFVVIAAYGAAPTFSYETVSSLVLPNLLSENQNSNDLNGNYIYNPQNGFLTEAMWGLSAVFSPLKNGKIQFLFDPNGSINSVRHQIG